MVTIVIARIATEADAAVLRERLLLLNGITTNHRAVLTALLQSPFTIVVGEIIASGVSVDNGNSDNKSSSSPFTNDECVDRLLRLYLGCFSPCVHSMNI